MFISAQGRQTLRRLVLNGTRSDRAETMCGEYRFTAGGSPVEMVTKGGKRTFDAECMDVCCADQAAVLSTGTDVRFEATSDQLPHNPLPLNDFDWCVPLSDEICDGAGAEGSRENDQSDQ